MARHAKREFTIDDFDAWWAARGKFEKIGEAADEGAGPSLSLVPAPEQNKAWATDLLPSNPPPACLGDGDRTECGGGAKDAHSSGDSSIAATPFDGIPLESSRRRLAGWSAERQRLFLGVLAETGSVHLAAAAARLSARSAYHLRTRSPAFAAAWNAAQQLAVGRLSAIAFDRALNGRVEQVFREGELIAERRVPSDRLLTWLLARLDPKRFALPWEQRGDADPQAEAVAGFPRLLEAVTDTAS